MSDEVFGRGELRSTKRPRPGDIELLAAPGVRKQVQFSLIDGMAVVEGDIIVSAGPAETLGLSGRRRRWPEGVVCYDIHADLPDPWRVHDAIRHWEEATVIRFQRRTRERDYVLFRPSDGCSAHVGMMGGDQFITLGPRCTIGNCIHEIGHAVGLWHEQSRADRDRHVTIVWENIDPDLRHNFDQQLTDGDDVGPYDFGSIMHYPANAFALDPARPTIVPTSMARPAEEIGQRAALSKGDVATVAQMYGMA